MLKKLLEMVLEQLNENKERDSRFSDKIVELVEEIDELETEHAEALSDAERWGDLDDKTNWRTAKVNKLERIIKSKRELLDKLTDY